MRYMHVDDLQLTEIENYLKTALQNQDRQKPLQKGEICS